MATRSDIMAGRAFVELYVKKEALTAGLQQARQKLQDFGNAANAMGRMLIAMGIAAGSGLLFASKHFIDFDDQMRAVKAAVSASEAEFRRLTEVARELGRVSGFSATQVGQLMLELGRAGFNPKQIEAMTESVLQLSRATGTNAATSAGIMSAAIRQFGLEATDAARVADGLTAAANMSFTSVEALGEALSYVGPVANDFGMAIEDVLAIMGTLGNIGIQGSEAGTVMRRLLTLTSSEAAKMSQLFGVAFRDARGNARPLIDVLEDVNNSTKHLGTSVRAAKFNEAFGLLGITGASALGKAAGSARQLAADIRDAGGIAAKTAKEMDSGPGGALRRLMGALDATALKIGEALSPMFIRAAEAGKIFADTITKVVANNQWLIEGMVKVTAGLLAGGAALLTIGTSAKVAAFGIGMLQVAMIPASYASGTLLAILKNASIISASAIRGFRGIAASLGSGFVGTIRAIGIGLGNVTFAAQTMAMGVLRAAAAAGNSILSGLTSVLGRVPAAFNAIVVAAQSAFAKVITLTRKFGAEIQYWLSRPFEYFRAITPLFAQDLQLQFANAMARIRAVSAQAAEGIKVAWTGVTARVQSAVGAATAYIASKFSAVASPVAAKVMAAWQAATSAITSRASAAWNAVANSAGAMLARIKARFGATLPLIQQDFTRIVGYATSAARGVVAAFAYVGPRIASGLVTAVGGAFARIRAMGAATAGMLGRGIGAGASGLGGLLAGGAGLLGMLGGSAGGALGQMAMIAPQIMLLASSFTMLINPATLAIAAVAAGIYVWTQYSKEGKAALASVQEAFTPLVATAKQTFGGVAIAIQNGNLSLAGKIAMAGLKLALIDGMIGLGQLIIGNWGNVTDEVGKEMAGGGMVTPWERALETMGALWDQWCLGVVRTFTDAARAVVNVWASTVEGIANSMLEAAGQGGVWGKLMSLILGVDVEAELARGEKLGLNRNEMMGGMKKDVADQVGGTAQALRKFIDELDRDAEARAKNSEPQLPNWQKTRDDAQKALNALIGQSKEEKDRRDAWDKVAAMLGENEKEVPGVAGGGKDGQGMKGMLEAKSLGATFSAAAAIAMGRGGAAGNPQERAAKAAEKQVQVAEDLRAFVGKNNAIIKKSQEILADIARNTKNQVARAG